jgi:cytochrome c-type biogenesis protein CcmH/NrfG
VSTKKQQRRRQKLKRHEYEEVYVDETGRELAPEEAEELVGTAVTRKTAAASKSRAAQRGGRVIEPPSWRRTAKRGLLFFPLMLIVVFLLSPDLSAPAKVFNTLVLMAFFVPFSYFMDTMMWRSYQRRLARTDEKKR